ncbi:MAG TPA: acyltransferase [Stellaceae bacterium]|jgi:peptidoglycan/LPS O-acetylase OafA/YrhL|nr:acyltransferase [Stellaceae bacterium]
MRTIAERPVAAAAPASLAIDNLRAVVIILVLSFHSVLAYLQFLPHHPFAFDGPPLAWRAFPIVDTQRWLGFDLYCAWQDVFLMSFFFMLSGLFAWPSLSRKGARAFLGDRLLRIGLPFAVVVLLLMPITQYPTYLQTAADPSIADYWRKWLALSIWPSGPMWFLWLLLIGDIAVAGLYQLMQSRREALTRFSHYARAHPVRFLAGVLLASVLAYVPPALVFGTQGWAQWGPFAVQFCRPLHYAVYFFAGVAIGACGIERGLLAADGPLARHWRRWLIAAPPLFFAWAGLTGLTMGQGAGASLGLQAIDDVSYAAACLASCFMVFALALHLGRRRWPVLDSLKANAYGMYLIHYLFVVWLQYALLGFGWPAIVKGAIVFAGTLALSWSATAALRREPWIAYLIGGERRRPAVRPVAAGSPGLAS